VTDGLITGDLAAIALRGMRFRTVYADPPWRYANRAARGAAENHYRTMTVEQIAALPVADLVTGNAHLHLWTTNAFLFEAKAVIDAWGFRYRSSFVWVKPLIGCGNYWRLAHEFLLLGVRGRCPFRDKTQRSWQEFRRSAHSAKPERIRDLVERVSPGPYLELFGRRPSHGWVVWGNQIERSLFDLDIPELAGP
jgi:N6-adenosine-specific RNA methylase IME4